jgi:hypothetical protein
MPPSMTKGKPWQGWCSSNSTVPAGTVMVCTAAASRARKSVGSSASTG